MRRSAPTPVAALVLALASALAGPVGAHEGVHTERALLGHVKFEQRIGARLPGDAQFLDADGAPVTVAGLAADRPLALMLVWFDCPNLCPIILGETARAADALPFASTDYRVAVVSIEPADGPSDARAVRDRLRQRYGAVLDNWHFLTGSKRAIDRLAQAVGFAYAYDADDDRYAHPAGLVVAAAGGKVSRYLLGLRPEPQNLRLALVDAGQGRVGSISDQVLLRCFRFNPENGQYTVAVIRLIQWIGGGFGLAMIGTIAWLRRRERG